MPKPFNLRITDFWKSTTRGLSDKMKGIINDKVENHIRHNPYGSESLKGSLEGLWSYNKLKSNNRIIFAICEDCRKRDLTSVNNCASCRQLSARTIMLWAFGGHDAYTTLERQRKKTWEKVKKKKRSRLRSR